MARPSFADTSLQGQIRGPISPKTVASPCMLLCFPQAMALVQGTGGFGSVYRARWRGRDVAVKCLPNLAEGGSNSSGGTLAQYEALVREIELSCRFNSPRLVKVLHPHICRPSVLAHEQATGQWLPQAGSPAYLCDTPFKERRSNDLWRAVNCCILLYTTTQGHAARVQLTH